MDRRLKRVACRHRTQSGSHPPPPPSHVLADAEFIRTLLIKPAETFDEPIAAGLGHAHQTSGAESVSQKLKPCRNPAHERLVGVRLHL
jgi:hypothetical protein